MEIDSSNQPTSNTQPPIVDQTLPTIERPPDIQPQMKKRINTKVIIGVVIVFVLLIIGLSLTYVKRFKEANNKTTQIPVSEINTTPTLRPNNQQPYKAKNWVLQKQTSNGTEVVFTLPDVENQTVLWGDYLFYGSGDYTTNVKVFSYNLKTGENKTIYDQELGNDLESGRRYVSDMQAINNTLFFSIGGYLTSGATFWMGLPPTGSPQKLTSGANGKIQYWKDRYWLINVEGDACWGGTSYSLIDLSTKKVTNIASSTSGCMEGEEFVDIDKRDKMIMAYHTSGSGEGGNEGNGIYQYVISIPLNNPSVKEGVIAKQDMPKGITSVIYLADTDQLLLSGTDKYLYSFVTKTITKTDVSPTIPTPTPSAQNLTFKDKVKDLKLPTGYSLVLE